MVSMPTTLLCVHVYSFRRTPGSHRQVFWSVTVHRTHVKYDFGDCSTANCNALVLSSSSSHSCVCLYALCSALLKCQSLFHFVSFLFFFWVLRFTSRSNHTHTCIEHIPPTSIERNERRVLSWLWFAFCFSLFNFSPSKTIISITISRLLSLFLLLFSPPVPLCAQTYETQRTNSEKKEHTKRKQITQNARHKLHNSYEIDASKYDPLFRVRAHSLFHTTNIFFRFFSQIRRRAAATQSQRPTTYSNYNYYYFRMCTARCVRGLCVSLFLCSFTFSGIRRTTNNSQMFIACGNLNLWMRMEEKKEKK